MLSVEKVYDELYGMIEDLKKQIAAGGGSDVTILPALESGTKIADFEIDDTPGVLYAPAPVPVDIGDVETVVGTYTYNGVTSVLYQKMVRISALPTTPYVVAPYAHGISDMAEVISFDAYIESTNGLVSLFNDNISAVQDLQSAISLSVDTTNCNVIVGKDRHTLSARVYIRYTKTPPEPEPEAKKTRKK